MRCCGGPSQHWRASASAGAHHCHCPAHQLDTCLSPHQGTSGKGGIGFLGNLRDLIWIPLQQVCMRASPLCPTCCCAWLAYYHWCVPGVA